MKYHSKKVEADGQKFDSMGEYRRWCELCEMLDHGLISDLRRQVPYELIPKQPRDPTIPGDRAERAVNYVADFVYELGGKTIVEDFKGFKTPEYRLKRKLLRWVHNIRIYESGGEKNGKRVRAAVRAGMRQNAGCGRNSR